MTQAAFSGLYASANATLLEIHGRNDLHTISFDDFRVVSATLSDAPPALPASGHVTAVPEPAAFALVLAGLGLISLFRRR